MAYGRKPAFKTVPGKFSSAQWRAGNAARTAAAARSSAVASRRAVWAAAAAAGRARRRSARTEERKFFDTALSFNFDATGEVPATGQVALIPQGDTESTRDGRKATIQSIQIRGYINYPPGAAATASDTAHLYVVLDTQANGAAAACTDVFTSTSLATAMLNLNNSGRFRILGKIVKTMEAQAGVTTAYNSSLRQIEFFKTCNIDMDWSNTDGAITGIRSNNIFLIAGSTGVDDVMTFTGTCRLRFVG